MVIFGLDINWMVYIPIVAGSNSIIFNWTMYEPFWLVTAY